MEKRIIIKNHPRYLKTIAELNHNEQGFIHYNAFSVDNEKNVYLFLKEIVEPCFKYDYCVHIICSIENDVKLYTLNFSKKSDIPYTITKKKDVEEFYKKDEYVKIYCPDISFPDYTIKKKRKRKNMINYETALKLEEQDLKKLYVHQLEQFREIAEKKQDYEFAACLRDVLQSLKTGRNFFFRFFF